MASVAHIIRRRRSRDRRRAAHAAQSRVFNGLVYGLIAAVILLPAGVTLGGALWLYADAVQSLPTPQQSRTAGPALGPTELYDRAGTTLLLASDAAATEWVRLTDLPTSVVQATLTAEDPDFLTAPGFDALSTVNRLWRNALIGPLALDTSLTGRLVQNAIAPLPDQPDANAVGREIALVAEIRRLYTPEEILEWHLNTNFYGGDAFGIEAAAQRYFGKRAVNLTLDEAAMLAAVPLAPQYNPFDNEVAARGRQLDLLRAMRAAELITDSQLETASTTRTVIQLAATGEQIAPEYAIYARRQAEIILDGLGLDGAQLVARGGLRITTALDLDAQTQAECALAAHLAALNGVPIPGTARDGQPCIAANLLPAGTTPIPSPPDSGVIVLIDSTTGEIRAMVGAATTVDRQPGVTLQPFAYFNAFVNDPRENPATMVLDLPGQRFPGAAEGLIYPPNNPDGQYRGPINLRDAVSAWLLPPAVQISHEWGMDNVLRRAHRIGLNSLGDSSSYDLSLLERGGAVSALDMTYAYSVFAALGDIHGVAVRAVAPGYRQRDPVAVVKITDPQGTVLWDYTAEQVALSRLLIFDAEVGWLINDMLADTRRRAAMLGDTPALDAGRPAAVVNGLAGDGTLNWTLGYTPQLTLGVLLHRADDTSMGLDPLGMQGAAPLWSTLLRFAHDRAGLTPTGWMRPTNLFEEAVCERSGLLPNGVCPTRTETFVVGRAPTERDTYWQSVELNRQTRLLATANTPLELRQATTYFIPPAEALDWWEANNQPLPPETYDTAARPEIFSSVQILQPVRLAYVGGVVEVRGSLDPANMQFFQLSYGQGLNPNEWLAIGQQQTSFEPGQLLGAWDTTNLPGGLYALLLTVQRLDNTLETATIQVTVDNQAPTVSLTAGIAGQVFRFPADRVIPLVAEAVDDYALDRVEFYRDGQFVGADTEYPYGFEWRITGAGTERFSAVAFDRVGNQTNTEVVVEVVR
jgi:membrane peptidoglycan carboxypeptidase